jgi:hypothetical protein
MDKGRRVTCIKHQASPVARKFGSRALSEVRRLTACGFGSGMQVPDGSLSPCLLGESVSIAAHYDPREQPRGYACLASGLVMVQHWRPSGQRGRHAAVLLLCSHNKGGT